MESDERFMWMAVDLARLGRGQTSPNPMVGAVVVKAGEVIATGYHKRAGAPHAEIVALEEAGERAEGAALYVNLEPCCHQGRTPPCVPAIIKAGIKKVVMAMLDPNPLVNGLGMRQLQAAGIKVSCGILEEKARQLNEVYIKYITRGLPFVMLKTAMSLDGKIATRAGRSRWITGEKARHFVHRLRDQVDGIIVGINTVLRDDPLLTTRLPGGGGRDAVRIIVDSMARLPLEARVINNASAAPVIVAATGAAPGDRIARLQDRGVRVLQLPGREGMVDLVRLMQQLGREGFSSILVEGGGTLNYSLLQQGLVDKVFFFIAPLLIGGAGAPTALGGDGIADLDDAWEVDRVNYKQLGSDHLLIGYPARRGE